MTCKKLAGYVVVLLTGLMIFVSVGGCQTDGTQTGDEGQEPAVPAVSMQTFPRVESSSKELVDQLKFADANVQAENGTLRSLRVPVTNISNAEVPIKYQFRFLNEAGDTISTSKKMGPLILPPQSPFFVESKAPQGTVDWRLVVERAW